MTSSKMNLENEGAVKKSSDFSIEHILSKAGNSKDVSSEKQGANNNVGVINFGNFGYVSNEVPYTWLQCSRYCPPKVPRKREGPQRRQLGRHPRIPFTTQQLSILEEKFKGTPYLSSEEVTKLSKVLQLADIRVKIWFQNRRARERRERQQLEQQISPVTQVNLQQNIAAEKNDCFVQINHPQNFYLAQNISLDPSCMSRKDLSIKQEPNL